MTARPVEIPPSHRLIRAYHQSITEIRAQNVKHEGGLRHAFQVLLADSARLHNWTLIPEWTTTTSGGNSIRLDGALRDALTIPRGYWEAKDSHDNLDREIEKKIRSRYPLDNTIFEDTQRAVLYQNGDRVFTGDLADTRQLSDLLARFYSFAKPNILELDRAVKEFSERVPELARGLAEKIAAAHSSNKDFQSAFATFFALCQLSLNPNIRREAVDEMLIQHLLTERLFRTVFDNPEFTRRNAIALEVERVIAALLTHSFSRDEYLRALDPFYAAIERAARDINDFTAKQEFLNNIYERFFRGYSVKVADTHGIVYTPPAIVEYMCKAVENALRDEFGLLLTSPEVQILDPCTGTGNFIVHLMRRMPRRDLARMYREQLFANEVMLMPYYIAALNIEHAYLELTGQYEPFEGLCFVDTLELAEGRQLPMFSERNTERVDREQHAKINVIIGNPPYNSRQRNENDNNKNRKYPVIDNRVNETYSGDSIATNKNPLQNMYVKFFRWAADRLNAREGIVCFVTNNRFISRKSFDGMRKHLLEDFTHVDHIDLHGDTLDNPKLSGTTHNVFGIPDGVGITVAVNRSKNSRRLRYHRVPEFWRKEEKLAWLREDRIEWRELNPESSSEWIVPEHAANFSGMAAITSVFSKHSNGLISSRDETVYNFSAKQLFTRITQFVENYNSEVDRYIRAGRPSSIDDFIQYDQIKWSSSLKQSLKNSVRLEFVPGRINEAAYRPFTNKFVYLDPVIIHRPAMWNRIFQGPDSAVQNRVIWLKIGSDWPMFALTTDKICDFLPQGGSQCFPYYTYNPDGTNQTENITDAALTQFRAHYNDPSITKWNIFHYIYAVLHHPGYREKFAENLRRELPRIPFAPDFHAFAEAGQRLADLHVHYEQLQPWDKLDYLENPAVPFTHHVERMRLSKDKRSLKINDALTLANIPPEVFDYRLGNRSALEWVIDQYRITEDPRSGIRSDPNRPDDPEYILRLVGQVIRLSLETVQIVRALPETYTAAH